jgi:hypothetical protein
MPEYVMWRFLRKRYLLGIVWMGEKDDAFGKSEKSRKSGKNGKSGNFGKLGKSGKFADKFYI